MRFHSVPGMAGILDHSWGPNWYNTNRNSIGIKTDPSPYILKNSTFSKEQSHIFWFWLLGGGQNTPKIF